MRSIVALLRSLHLAARQYRLQLPHTKIEDSAHPRQSSDVLVREKEDRVVELGNRAEQVDELAVRAGVDGRQARDIIGEFDDAEAGKIGRRVRPAMTIDKGRARENSPWQIGNLPADQ